MCWVCFLTRLDIEIPACTTLGVPDVGDLLGIRLKAVNDQIALIE